MLEHSGLHGKLAVEHAEKVMKPSGYYAPYLTILETRVHVMHDGEEEVGMSGLPGV